MPDVQLFDTPDTPARKAQALTTGIVNTLATPCKAIYCGGAGDLIVTAVDDTVAVTFAVGAGSIIPIRSSTIGAGSTATGMIALF